jgi:signal transduction histidine kinase
MPAERTLEADVSDPAVLTSDPSLPFWRRVYSTRPLTLAAVLVGWFAILASYRQHWLGPALALVTTALAYTALRRGHTLAQQRRGTLRRALEATESRNRVLERLRRLAATLLAGRALAELYEEVAAAAEDLLHAEGGAVTLVVEEGRFLRVVAATGPIRNLQGQLVPVDHSLLGWVLQNDQAVLSDDIDADPRAFRLDAHRVADRSLAAVPLHSAGIVIGTLAAYNRRDGHAFTTEDLQLLQTLGDQVVVGLDRAAMLEDSRQSQQALAAKNQELLRATRLKSEFLANMSHELRTPLNAIIGFSDLTLSGGAGEVTETQAEYLEAVLRNGRHLLNLINSVLDLSKVEAGQMNLALAPVGVQELVQGLVADTASLRAAKRQTCTVHMLEAPVLSVVADGVRLRQILFNLLSNASKFTADDGQIEVRVLATRAPLPVPLERSGDQARLVTRDAVWIAVADSGIGIRREDMPKLFREFSQVESAHNRQQQGTGLGLALSKSFVEMHGGVIGADSIFGRGTTVWFILPVEGPVRRSVSP